MYYRTKHFYNWHSKTEFVNVNYTPVHTLVFIGFHYKKKTRLHAQFLYSQILQLILAEQTLALKVCKEPLMGKCNFHQQYIPIRLAF